MGFDSRFRNWVSWCKARGMFLGHAGSAEGWYRSPQSAVWDPPAPKVELNEVDAIFLNSAYCQLASYPRRVIKVIYFRQHWKPKWQAQKLGCLVENLPIIDRDARGIFSDRIDFLEKRVHTTGTVNPVRRPLGAIFV